MEEQRKQSFQQPIVEENKENEEVNEPVSSSYESLGILRNENTENCMPGFNQGDRAKYAKEAMAELLTLIEEVRIITLDLFSTNPFIKNRLLQMIDFPGVPEKSVYRLVRANQKELRQS